VNAKNTDNSKKRARINTKLSGKTSKRTVLPSIQKSAKRKSSFVLKSKKPKRYAPTPRQRAVVISFYATKGRKLEITEGIQIIPFLNKLRKKMGYPKANAERVTVTLLFDMESGAKPRSFAIQADHPQLAKKSNAATAQAIDTLLKEGASETKTSKGAYLINIQLKRLRYV
jgi:hypothetical protein